jgi:starvation-inducible DNA-binding protein
MHTYQEYLESSAIKSAENIRDGKRAVQKVVGSLSTVLLLQRELLDLSAAAGDEGTNALMSDYIRAQEKLVWMYSAYLG